MVEVGSWTGILFRKLGEKNYHFKLQQPDVKKVAGV
jgi:hypothetical protein